MGLGLGMKSSIRYVFGSEGVDSLNFIVNRVPSCELSHRKLGSNPEFFVVSFAFAPSAFRFDSFDLSRSSNLSKAGLSQFWVSKSSFPILLTPRHLNPMRPTIHSRVFRSSVVKFASFGSASRSDALALFPATEASSSADNFPVNPTLKIRAVHVAILVAVDAMLDLCSLSVAFSLLSHSPR